MTRREWLAMVAATPLVKAAPQSEANASSAPAASVAIAKAASYDDDITARLKTMFDQLGGIEKLVKNKNRHREAEPDRGSHQQG